MLEERGHPADSRDGSCKGVYDQGSVLAFSFSMRGNHSGKENVEKDKLDYILFPEQEYPQCRKCTAEKDWEEVFDGTRALDATLRIGRMLIKKRRRNGEEKTPRHSVIVAFAEFGQSQTRVRARFSKSSCSCQPHPPSSLSLSRPLHHQQHVRVAQEEMATLTPLVPFKMLERPQLPYSTFS